MHFLSLSCVLLVCIVITHAQGPPPPKFPGPPRNRPPVLRNIPIPVRQYVVENKIKVHEITRFKRPKPGLKARRNRLPPNAMKGSCQQSGCPQGMECALQGSWVCPRWIPSLPCQCQPGCRHRNILIKPGETKRIDNCGSTCSCYSMLGTVQCNHKNC